MFKQGGPVLYLGITLLVLGLMFMHFRRKVSTLEFKVNTLFKLVQDHMEQQQQQQYSNSMYSPQNNIELSEQQNLEESLNEEQLEEHVRSIEEMALSSENVSRNNEGLIEVSESESETETETESESEEEEEEQEQEQEQENQSSENNVKTINLEDLVSEDSVLQSLQEDHTQNENNEINIEELEVEELKTINLEETQKDFSKMKVAELRELVSEQNPEVDASKLKKPQLVEMLKQ